jgi:REP element-mobilizing transposase RayT
LKPPLRSPLFAYIGGIVRHFGGKPLAINGVADHVHLLFSLPQVRSGSFRVQVQQFRFRGQSVSMNLAVHNTAMKMGASALGWRLR